MNCQLKFSPDNAALLKGDHFSVFLRVNVCVYNFSPSRLLLLVLQLLFTYSL